MRKAIRMLQLGVYACMAFAFDARVLASQAFVADQSYSSAGAFAQFGDIDGDGDLDAIWSGFTLEVYINDGSGTFRDETAQRAPALIAPMTSRFIDVDRDRDLDIVAVSFVVSGNTAKAILSLLINNGQGQFVDSTSLRMPTSAYQGILDVVCGDVDSDGDLDIALIVATFANNTFKYGAWIYINNGAGYFADQSAIRLPAGIEVSSLALADFYGDDKRDLLLVVWPNPHLELYVNTGLGVFMKSVHALPPLTGNANKLIPGDFSGDGKLDVFVTSGGRDMMLFNQGGGIFADSTAQLPAPLNYIASGFAEAGDFNGDGKLDLIVSGHTGQNLYSGGNQWNIYRNDGAGSFGLLEGVVGPTWGSKSGAAVGDLDGDGDDDFLEHYTPSPIDPTVRMIYKNHYRQIAAPLSAKLGRPLSVEIYSSVAPAVVLPFLSLGRAVVRLPGIGGYLQLDPQYMVALGAYGMQSPGRLIVTLPIPGDTSLAGLPISLQAAVVSGTSYANIGFTNAVSRRLER